MPKEILEQPTGDNNESEMSQEERDAIKAKEDWLHELMNLALEKLYSDFEAGIIPNEDLKKKYEDSLLQANEEIASADERSKNIQETLSRLDEIGSRFERLLGKRGDDKNFKEEALKDQERKGLEIKLPHGKMAANINVGRKDRINKGVGLYRMRARANMKNYRKPTEPPAI